MSQSYSVAELKPLVRKLQVCAMVPLGAAAELFGMTKSGLLRKLEGGHPRLQMMSITSESSTTWNGITVDSLADELDLRRTIAHERLSSP